MRIGALSPTLSLCPIGSDLTHGSDSGESLRRRRAWIGFRPVKNRRPAAVHAFQNSEQDPTSIPFLDLIAVHSLPERPIIRQGTLAGGTEPASRDDV